jgi:hypothetical protein
MYFPELNRLREANPDQAGTLIKLDRYLARLTGPARLHIAATDVAQAIEAQRDKVIGLLMAAAHLGLLRVKFRVSCPTRGHGIRDFEKLAEIPRTLYCDVCDEEHPITPDDVEYFFELVDHTVAARR